jgi:hypothetical protein
MGQWLPLGRWLLRHGGPQLDGEAIPLTEVIELAVGNGHLHGLVLREVWRLEFVLLLQGTLLVLFLVVEADAMLPVEEVDIA